MMIRAGLFLIAGLTVAVPDFLAAQGDVVWNAYVGPSTSSLGTDRQTDNLRRGMTLGFGWTHQATRNFAFELGAAYVERGGRATSENGSSGKLNLDYVDVPISVRIGDQIDDNLVFLRFGVAYSTELRCSMDEEVVFGTRDFAPATATSVVFVPSDECSQVRSRRTDVSPLAGVGVLIRSGPVQMTFEIRQSIGLDLSTPGSGSKARSRSTTFLMGFGFKER